METNERKEIIKKIYDNLGVGDCYTEDGGLGFGLVNKGILGQYSVVLCKEAYQVLKEARKMTDETGVEYPFFLFGFITAEAGEPVLFIKKGMLDKGVTNNGRCRMSDDFLIQVNKALNEQGCGLAIQCHTHPEYYKTTVDRSEYEKSAKYHERLEMREFGYNISNGDISQLVDMKIQQSEQDNQCMFLQGISLPNGEFNILDIESVEDNPILVSLPTVLLFDDVSLSEIDTFWSKEKKEEEKTPVALGI